MSKLLSYFLPENMVVVFKKFKLLVGAGALTGFSSASGSDGFFYDVQHKNVV
jgi:hypothetical protein